MLQRKCPAYQRKEIKIIFQTIKHMHTACQINLSQLFFFFNFNLEFLKGNDTHPVTFPISSLNIKKDPCSNVDPVVKETCQESPVDCPDVALRHCEENNLEAGSNCFIQARNSQIMTSFSLFLGTR